MFQFDSHGIVCRRWKWAAGKWREGRGGGGGGGRQRERNCSSLYLCSSIYIAILTNGGENSIIVDPHINLSKGKIAF